MAGATLPGAMLLNQGQPAPYQGVLLKPEQARIIYTDLKDYEDVKIINTSLEASLQLYKENTVIYEQEISQFKTQNLTLQTALEKSNSGSFWSDALWFIGGIITTSAIIYATDRH